MDWTAIDAWLDEYVRAWRSDDPKDIGALFEPDARYYPTPSSQPEAGRDRIVEWWTANGDSSLQWTFEHEVLASEGDLHVVRGITEYPKGFEPGDRPRVYDNLWLVTLAASGKASEFVEYWMLRRGEVA
jgi:hypothetical protein